MLWERAKNLILLFFLVLNLILAFLLYREQNRYALTTERSGAIRSVMNANKISMYKQIPAEFPPMRSLTLSGHSYDTEYLLSIFFGSPDKALRVDGDGRAAYENETGRLSILNGYISYEKFYGAKREPEPASGTPIDSAGVSPVAVSPVPVSPVAVGRAAATNLCEETFIDRYYPDYFLDVNANEGVETNADGSLRLYYRQVYNGYVVYGNFIEFVVTADGITQIEMQYGTALAFTDQRNDICAPDEALLTFIKRIRNVYTEPVLITGMDIVYYQEEFSAQEDTELYASPFYRVFTENNFEPFLINAYTNECIN